MKLFTLRFFGRMRWTGDEHLEWHEIEVMADSLFEAKLSVMTDYKDVSQIQEMKEAS